MKPPRTSRRAAILLVRVVAFAAVTWASAAVACPVCFAAKGEANRKAFVATTVFLSALPLVMIGTCVWWAAERIRRHELHASERSTERDSLNEDARSVR